MLKIRARYEIIQNSELKTLCTYVINHGELAILWICDKSYM